VRLSGLEEALETVQVGAAAEKLRAEHNGTDGAVAPEENPLSRVIGGFADDPLWDEFIEEMERSRRELDRQHGLSEPHPSVLENDTV